MKAETLTGGCGDNLTWSLDTETGVLTISGTGAMADYYWDGAPWSSNRSLIQTATIEEGVTTIGSYAFPGCSNLTSVTIPNGVTQIGQSPFEGTPWYDNQKDFTMSGNAQEVKNANFINEEWWGIFVATHMDNERDSVFWSNVHPIKYIPKRILLPPPPLRVLKSTYKSLIK
jgi:hypothetical protein